MKKDKKTCRTFVRNSAKSCKDEATGNYKRVSDSPSNARTTKPRKFTKRQIADLDHLLLEWYALGWGVNPKRITPAEVFRFLTFLGTLAEASWKHAIRTGHAPDEDINPAEGFYLMAFFVLEAARLGKVKSLAPGGLVDRYYHMTEKSRKESVRQVVKMANKVVPGYFKE